MPVMSPQWRVQYLDTRTKRYRQYILCFKRIDAEYWVRELTDKYHLTARVQDRFTGEIIYTYNGKHSEY